MECDSANVPSNYLGSNYHPLHDIKGVEKLMVDSEELEKTFGREGEGESICHFLDIKFQNMELLFNF